MLSHKQQRLLKRLADLVMAKLELGRAAETMSGHARVEAVDDPAHRDPLTGLLNRHSFCELIDTAIATDEQAAILLIDIDRFRTINESIGHERGDSLLRWIAIRLGACLDPAMHLARMGDDDFAVLLKGGRAEAYALALAIQIAMSEPFDLNDQRTSLTVSVGVSTIQDAGNSVRLLLAAANMALFAAKAEGRQHCQVFKPEMRDRVVNQRDLSLQLRSAATNAEFVMHYQPQVDLETGDLIGCEALLRWNHPEQGLLYPGAFIRALEHAECSEDVGWWTLNESCRQLAAWDRAGLHVPCVGVNLFANQFCSANFVDRLWATLAANQLTPDRLELELTESIALTQGDSSLGMLASLRQAGVKLALDDFGTGFASLSTLKRIPLTRLKIDKSYVNDLDGGTHDAAVVRAVVGIACDLRVSVIAEGIETLAQANKIRQMGCREGQGFLYGRGLPAAEFARKFSPRVPSAA
jgi:diguanylate cyclase (GGDEF)-like protein